ncbi:hypothetical protein TGAMA5MH_05657 [Trichoderma gamsii]|uniref:FHA domain-containing protein n=1 Tax=Trichoderma gamsii TaxID=398673 RepID=A0A2K0TBL9_9HYPO|nr:hypothetical protein TGAMA5MH_05657 [Trichoderma gamsii]
MAQSVYRDEALVRLTVVNPSPDFAFPTRSLLLTKSNTTIPLGRMSKKNGVYAAREDNGWIDSAVMSRDHAKLIFDPQSHSVFIKDIGSLHGTFFNNTRLKKHQAQVIKDGDLIQFGIPIDRGSETNQACVMRAGIQFGTPSSLQGPTVFRVPDDSDDEAYSDEDNAIRSSSKILHDHGIRPDPNFMVSDNAVITIESDHEMDSSEPELEHEDGPLSPRAIQDQMRLKILESAPTPDEDALFYGDDYEESYMSEDNDDRSTCSLDQTLRRSFLGDDHTAAHVEATVVHEAEIVDRFENDCLPPILSASNAAAAPDDPAVGVHLPSFNDTFRSQEVSVNHNNAATDINNDAASVELPSDVHSPPALGFVEPKFWPEDVALNRATASSLLLDSGADFLNSPLKEHPGQQNATPPLDLDETSAYQFEVTKTAIAQQQQQQALATAPETGAGQPLDQHVKSSNGKRKAEEISELTAEEISFAERDPSPLDPQTRDDSAMDIDDHHPGHGEPHVKRLRRAAEIFGYAAIGGVAVMSALIATAPTL